MQPDRFTNPATSASAVTYDAGLRAHMQRIYNRMSLGVLVTAVTAWVVASSPALMGLLLGGPQMYIVMFAPLAVLWFGFNPATMPSGKLQASFFLISILYGISFSAIFFAFAREDIARAFFIAAAMFAGLSIFGYTTKKNLDGLGSFAIMGIWGVFIASLLGIFLPVSSGMQHVISGVAILAFAGLTAWQTQTMKEMYHPSYGDEGNSRMAWSAALTLYISFIALFQNILHLMSSRN